MNSDINFKGNNPGAVKFGNFINYYSFNSAENRIKLFPTNILQQYVTNNCVCLDIGCNAGNLTTLLFKFLTDGLKDLNCNILGIDIDPILIERAKETNIYKDLIEFHCLDYMSEDQTNIIENYLSKFNKTRFNIIFCMSVTMWIHLNYGDDGLENFLRKMCSNSELIVIEPQPWKCYKSAVKRLKQSNDTFAMFDKIKNKQNVEKFVEDVISSSSFVKIRETEPTKWNRNILFFVRQ